MGQKRGRGRSKADEPDPPAVAEDPAPDAGLSESQLARVRLRQRWELASVLNFFTVFREKVGTDSKITAEEIETGLITPNGDLAQIHISLLKGIPPTNKNLRENDAWVTIVCKKLANWWPWVAKGEIPLEADHGEEIEKYKELDPITRLLILKALCELRALQGDIMKYVADGLKSGIPISTFRKEKIGGDDNGSIYWYDGDPVVGYRLYKEITGIDSKKKLKGKVRQTQLAVEPQWETLATNLEEFCEISENLSSSKNKAEAAIGEIVKTDIIPVLENLQKKKERALKRQQTQAMLLDGFLYSNGRQTRERKPVKYTFDEYDRAIDEAIHISTKSKTATGKNTNKVGKHVANEATAKDSDKENSNPIEDHGSPADVGDNEGVMDNEKNEGITLDHDDEGNNYNEKNEDRDGSDNVEEDDGDGSNSEEDDQDGSNYDDKDDDHDGSNYEDDDGGDDDHDGSNYEDDDGGDDDDDNSSVGDDSDGKSDEKDGNYSTGDSDDSDEEGLSRAVRVKKDAKAKKKVKKLRRSRNGNNTEGNGHGEAKKRLRQRPTRNIDYNDESDSDSDDDDFVSSDGDED